MELSRAYKAIILLGTVSLFADMTYEGGRSIIPGFLRSLGASYTDVGLIVGSSEFLGYATRLPAGLLADLTGSYWTATLVGYVINMLSVPLLAVVPSLSWAAILIISERLGKALRSPARDVILSAATEEIGTGRAFGLHELMDQIGALLGPVVVALALLIGRSIRWAFSFLLLPATVAILMVLMAYLLLKDHVMKLPRGRSSLEGIRSLPTKFWIYVAAVAVSTAGFLHYALIAYRMQELVDEWTVALSFGAAMGIDAVAAVSLGLMYDRCGLSIFPLVFVLNTAPALLAITKSPYTLVAAVLWFGVGMGAQESIYRSVIADLSPLELRGTAYGVFNLAYGVAWVIGGGLMGLLYDMGMPELVAVMSGALQTIAILLLKRSTVE